MPIPDDFAALCLYAPEAWFIHDVLELNHDEERVVALIDTTRLGFLVDSQRAFQGHPKHLPGAICVQVTGTLGALMANYVHGMRMDDGWAGFGTHIHHARFPNIGVIGPAVHAECRVLKKRTLRGTTFVRYGFEYRQGDKVVYESEQTAGWRRGA